MRRYLTLLGVSLRASLTTAMQYRVDFMLDGLISLWWVGWTLVPLLVVFGGRQEVAGWSLGETLVVIAWFTLLRGLLEAAINPSLVAMIEAIRTGALDFVLLKPADAQFLVSTAKFQPWKLIDMAAGLAMVVIAFQRLGRLPALVDVALAGALLGAAALVMYSMWILVLCASFWVVRLDNLTYLFNSIFDAARWPIDVYRGAWRILFTFVIPLGLMTTVPAMAILGNLRARTAVVSMVGALVFGLLARLAWLKAVGRYTSASS